MQKRGGPGWRGARGEARRLVAARCFRAGRLSQSDIARTVGVSEAALSQWRARWRHGRDRCLRARPTGHAQSYKYTQSRLCAEVGDARGRGVK
jgi:transposase-like protein